MSIHCELCPIAAGRWCPAFDHPPFCDHLRDDQPGRRDQIRAIAHYHETGDDGAGAGAAAPDVDPLAVFVDLCEWGQSGPCGCQPGGPPRVCLRPDRPRQVLRAWCAPCQSGAWREGDPPPPGQVA